MANPKLSEAQHKQTVELVEKYLRQGYRPKGITGAGDAAIAMAGREAVKLGWVNSHTSFISRVVKAEIHGFVPDWSLYAPARYQQPVLLFA